MSRKLLAVVLLVSLSPPTVADGPETGVVTGRVVVDGAGLAGARVLLEGERGSTEVITDAEGVYRFGLVTPGTYAVTASQDQFKPSEGRVSVTAGGKVELDLLLVLTASEVVSVVAEAPLIDRFEVVAGATIPAGTADEISASNRTFYGAIDVLPGVTHDQESAYLDDTRPTVNGSLWQESSVYVDGVDTTYSMRGGGTRVIFPTTALAEMSVRSAGSGSEYGRNVGSHTNLIVKSGTNVFHGEAQGVFARDRWNSNYRAQPALAEDEELLESFEQKEERGELGEGVEPSEAAKNFLVFDAGERDGGSDDIEASLGGPIARDRVWFFLSRGEASTNRLDKLLDGTVLDVSTGVETWLAKLTAQPGGSHSLSVTYIDSPVERLFLLPPMADRYTSTLFDISGDVGSLSWNYAWSSRLFLETKVARQTSNENRVRPFDPMEKARDPDFLADQSLGALAPVNNDASYVQRRDNTWHNGWIFPLGYGTNEFPRDQLNIAVTQFAGKHELRYGLDLQQVRWNQEVRRPNLYSGFEFDTGNALGFENGCVGSLNEELRDTRCFFLDYNPADVVAAGRGTGRSDGRNDGAYVRDRIDLGRSWSLNLGLRLASQRLENDRGRRVIDSEDVSPRLTAVYDVKKDGRQLFSLSYGRFFTQTPQNLVNTNLQEDWTGASNALDLRMHYGAIGFVAARPASIACTLLDRFTGLPIVDDAGPYCVSLGSVRPGELWAFHDDPARNIDIDIEPYHRDEIVLGYERQFKGRWVLDAKAIWWRVDNLIGSTLQRDDQFGLFLLVENYDDYAGVLRELDWVDNFTAQGIGSREQAEAILDGFEDDNRDYRALQLQFNRPFRDGWALYSNLTLSRLEGATYGTPYDNLNDDYGRNLEFILTEDMLQLVDCELRGLPQSCVDDLREHLGEPLSTINRHGRMPIDREWIFKTFGFKRWHLGRHGLTLGGSFRWQAGSAFERTQSLFQPTIDIEDNAINQPVQTFLVPRGSLENGDFWSLNMSGAWDFALGGRARGRLRLEAANVLNEQAQVATNSRTGRPLRSRRSFQRPRILRVLAGISF